MTFTARLISSKGRWTMPSVIWAISKKAPLTLMSYLMSRVFSPALLISMWTIRDRLAIHSTQTDAPPPPPPVFDQRNGSPARAFGNLIDPNRIPVPPRPVRSLHCFLNPFIIFDLALKSHPLLPGQIEFGWRHKSPTPSFNRRIYSDKAQCWQNSREVLLQEQEGEVNKVQLFDLLHDHKRCANLEPI